MTVSPRKALGQHFLSDRALLARIAKVTGATADHVVLEIGAGPGGLTAALLDRGATVVAIERDQRLRDDLLQRFHGCDFVLAAGDALQLNWSELVAPWTARGKTWGIAGNIPYNITSPLLEMALSPPLPASVTFLVQREVADRIVAPAGDAAYGALSINIQAVAEASRRFTIARGAFHPPPKVDSAVLHLLPRARPILERDRIGDFRRMVTSLFSYRRKRIHRALREAIGVDAARAADLLRAAEIDPELRPERIDVEGFVRLFDAVGGRDR